MVGAWQDDRELARSKRAAAAEIRRIARTVSLHADRVILIGHASSLEIEAAGLEDKAEANDRARSLRA